MRYAREKLLAGPAGMRGMRPMRRERIFFFAVQVNQNHLILIVVTT